jgi:hypothetical protein
VAILAESNFNGVLSVECGTPEQAERSLRHLQAAVHGEAHAAACSGPLEIR